MRVSVLVPYRASEHRARAWAHVSRCYRQTFPEWELVEGDGARDGWCKAEAVADALTRATGDVLVIADADVWCDDIAAAVYQVEHGIGWAMPHRRVWRLDEAASQRVYDGEDPKEVASNARARAERPHPGVAGGGIVVLTREAYEDCPLDPRFVGWGGEDHSWADALVTFHGGEWRGDRPLWHFWHEPQERMTRAKGNPANDALRKRYVAACHQPEQMRALVEEGRCQSHGSSPAPARSRT